MQPMVQGRYIDIGPQLIAVKMRFENLVPRGFEMIETVMQAREDAMWGTINEALNSKATTEVWESINRVRDAIEVKAGSDVYQMLDDLQARFADLQDRFSQLAVSTGTSPRPDSAGVTQWIAQEINIPC